MWSRRGVLLGAASAAIAPSAWAEELGDMSGDIAILRDAYETLHPGLYRYATPREVGARFDALARAWSRPQTRAEAYLSLSRFLATVKCGHTYANFYNQTEAVQAELFDAQRLLPFQFAWIDGRMVVLANQSGDARLARGAEVLSINGRSTPGILRSLMAYARADGSNDAKRRALLEVRGFDRYETFDVFYGLIYRPGASMSLRVRPPGASRAETFEVATIDLATRRSLLVAEPEDNGPVWTLTYPRAQTALLTMPNWALYDSAWDWRGFLDQSFAEIAAQNVTKLIVDVRGNEGGLDCGDLIVARLTDTPIAREGYARRTRYRQTPERLNQYLDTWDRSFRNWGDDAVPRNDGFYDLRGEADVDQIEPLGPRFRGDVDVLIDSQNSSATFQFASCIKNNRLGRLIGAPTGGNQRGINGGAFFFLRLPASGLEADLPLIARFPLTPKPDAGIVPDVAILLTREDIAIGRDAALEFALG
ncbi:MAG: S41 family peptidase [Alphaproteobacteria bacterium]|nr:S41 family peptidase [Alphaproteobacteria bacterium]